MKQILFSSIVVTFIAISAMTYSWIHKHGFHRPYVNWGIRDLAEYLVQKNRSPEECFNLVWFDIGMQAGEAQAECIYRYAELTKDPSACELLMPSSYGWDCLGAAEESNARMCWFDFSKERYSNSKPVMPECGGKNDSSSHRCCEMGKFLYVEKASNCDEFNDSATLHDQCLELMAKRDKNLVLCSQIEDENVRSGCEVAVRALQKD